MRNVLASLAFLLLGSSPIAAVANERAAALHATGFDRVDALSIGGPMPGSYSETFEFGPAPTPADYSNFGSAIATWVDSATGTKWAVIGAQYEDNYKGAAYVYVLYPQSRVWHQQARLTASDAATDDLFGASVSIDGGFIAVGAPHVTVSGHEHAGAAYVFAYDSSKNVWQPQDKVTGSAEDYGNTGGSVALRGNTLAVGAPWALHHGAVFLAERSGIAWTYTKAIVPPDDVSSLGFGQSIALRDSGLLVGMPNGAGFSPHGEAFLYARAGADWTLSQRIDAGDDAFDGDNFGVALAWSGSKIAIGASGRSNSVGAVFVYSFDSFSCWTKTARIIPNDAQENGWFGESVALDGSTLIAGSSPADAHGNGAAYLFHATGDSWTPYLRIQHPPSNDTAFYDLGASVALVDGQIFIGAPDASYARVQNARGAVLVYDADAPNAGAAEVLHPSRVNPGGFRNATALAKNTLIVSSLNETDSTGHQGIASVFTRDATGQWTWQTDFSQPAYYLLGYAFGCSTLATDGDTAVIGSPGEQVGASHPRQGMAYVKRRSADSASGWTDEAVFLDYSGSANDYFGCSVALSGDTAFIGAPTWGDSPGKVFVFMRTGTEWTLKKELSASDAVKGDLFGTSIATSGNQMVIGAPGHDAAYLFVRSGSDWVPSKKITPSDVKDGDYFGASVTMDGSTIAVRAAGKDETYLFGGPTWGLQQHIDSPAPALSDGSVQLQGKRLVVTSSVRQEADVYKKQAGSWKLTSSFSDDSWTGYLWATLSGPELVVSNTSDGGGGRAYLFEDDQLFADGFEK